MPESTITHENPPESIPNIGLPSTMLLVGKKIIVDGRLYDGPYLLKTGIRWTKPVNAAPLEINALSINPVDAQT